jgi:hypothetical protein
MTLKVPGHTQLAIALGKLVAGYRPGDDGFTKLDQEAVEYAQGDPFVIEEMMRTPPPPRWMVIGVDMAVDENHHG